MLLDLLRYTTTGHYKPSSANLEIVLGAVIYFLLPLDLLPDFIPITGLLDDVSVIAWCYVAAKDELDRFSAWLARVTGEIEVVHATQAAIARFLDRTNIYVSERRNQPPSTGSPYDREQQARPNEESLDTGLSLAWFLLEALGEHVGLFCKALQPPVEVIAPATCVRVMLESSARIQWLLDSDIDGKERVGRVYAIRYQELEQDRKFFSAYGSPDAMHDCKTIHDRMCQVTADAARHGYRRVMAKRGRNKKQIGIHVPVPKTTDLIRDATDQEIPYRLLSGLAHTRVLSLRRWCYESLPDTDGPGGSAVKTLPPDKIALLGALAAACIKDSVMAISRYLGWDLVLLQEIADEATGDINKVMERVVGPLPESDTC